MKQIAMVKRDATAWCPGCGNFLLIEALETVLNDLNLAPEEVVLVGGIGQAAKTNQYFNCNGFSGLHGRSLPAAVGIKMINQDLTVIVNTGDGDSYGEGGNHFIHNMRRNVDITHFVHNNQVYGLTKGQVSPTTDPCLDAAERGFCNLNQPLNPILLAIAAGATFVARSFVGDREQMTQVMKAAIQHRGYALVDILQPCVSFNKKNTFNYYKQAVQPLPSDHDRTNRLQALERSLETTESHIPTGIFYQKAAPDYMAIHQEIFAKGPILHQRVGGGQIDALVEKLL